MSDRYIPDEKWQDWAEVVRPDLDDPTFAGLVDEIEADQQAWASEEPQG